MLLNSKILYGIVCDQNFDMAVTLAAAWLISKILASQTLIKNWQKING